MGFLIGDLIARVGANIDPYRDAMREVSSTLDRTASKFGTAGAAITAAITLPLVGVAAAAIKTAGDLEQNTIAFKTMMGSADAAGRHLQDLRDFAAKTPFQFSDLVLASKRMQALGFDAKQVVPVLTNVGDAAAALGMGAEGVQRIITALGQMKAKGMVQAEEMRQLAEAGIPAWQILAKTLNTDVAGAMKAVENRTVSAATAVPALLAGMNEKFGGLMQKQSQTLMGQWSNLKDQITFTLTDVGTALMPVAKNMMENVLSPALGTVKDLAKAFTDLPKSTQTAVMGLAAFFAVIGPGLFVVGKLVTTVGALQAVITTSLIPALTGPLGLIALIGVGLVAAGYAAYDSLQKLETGLHTLDAAFQKWIAKQIDGADTADKLAKAEETVRAAMEAGALSAVDGAKALELIAQKEKALVGSGMNSLLGERAVKLHLVADEQKKTALSADEMDKAFKALGLKNTKSDLDEAVKSFQMLAAAGALTHAQMLQAAAAIGQMRSELAAVKADIAAAPLGNMGDYRTTAGPIGFVGPVEGTTRSHLEDLRDLPLGNSDVSNLPSINRNMELLRDTLGAQATEAALAQRNIDALTDAYHELGLKTPQEIQKAADSAQLNYEIIRDSGTATAHDIDVAFVEYKLRQIELDHVLGDTDDELYAQQKRNAEDTLKTLNGTSKEGAKAVSMFGRQISTVFTDLGRSLTDVLFRTKSIGEAFRDTGKAVVRIIAEDFIQAGFGKLVGFLKSTVLPHLGSVGKAIAGVLGGGGGASKVGTSIIDETGAVSNIGGGAAGAAGGAASGLVGVLGAVGSLGSMVTGIISNFQMHGIGNDTGKIEVNTRGILAEVSNLRADSWLREDHLMRKIDDVWNSIRDIGKGAGAYFDFRGATFGGGLTQSQVNQMMQLAYQQAMAKVG